MPDSYPQLDLKLAAIESGSDWPMFDLDLGPDGGPQTVTGSTEMAQKVRMNLLSILGQYWDGQRVGLRWMELLGMKPPSLDYFRSEVLRELFRHDRVNQVDSLTLSFDEGARHVRATAVVSGRDGSKVKVVV